MAREARVHSAALNIASNATTFTTSTSTTTFPMHPPTTTTSTSNRNAIPSIPSMPSPNRTSMLPTTRGYQLEMLHTSLQKNIIIALDTGSGKTHIAVLRIKREIEMESTKISWFLAPTVTLCKQQLTVLRTSLPVSIGLISGESDPNQWKDSNLWNSVLRSHRVMVSTPQVLLDALRHGYVVLGRDVGLVVFDEAHHAVGNDPYNRIMKEFYFGIAPSVVGGGGGGGLVRPMILGLTASPIFGGDPAKAFMEIEKNLDSTICTPLENRDELTRHIHLPEFRHILYQPPNSTNSHFSTNLATLHYVVNKLDIKDDPYVLSLKRQLTSKGQGTPDWRALDQKLSKTIRTENSFTQKGLRDFARSALDIAKDLGSWPADWFIWNVVQKAIYVMNPQNHILSSWKDGEKGYLLKILKSLVLTSPSMAGEDVVGGLSDKTQVLVRCLVKEKEETEGRGDAYSGIVFVQRRDAVIALSEVLKRHPDTNAQHMFRPGCLLGSSDSSYRHSFLDITRYLLHESQEDVLMDFRIGQKNLLISTSVAEEGVDIQACGSVIRWDPPPNMASWAQSRGRARKRQSTFTLLFQDGSGDADVVGKWQELERKMVELYRDPDREGKLRRLVEEEQEAVTPLGNGEGEEEEDEGLEFKVESTGATLTLHSAVSHLAHFCATIPHSMHVTNAPIYLLDPPEHPSQWHDPNTNSTSTTSSHPHPYAHAHAHGGEYLGPWGATLVLPRMLPWNLRELHVPRKFGTKVKAYQHVAFMAYKALYEAGLLNDHLLPWDTGRGRGRGKGRGMGGEDGEMGEDEDEDEEKMLLKEKIGKRKGMEWVGEVQVNPWKGLGGSGGEDVSTNDEPGSTRVVTTTTTTSKDPEEQKFYLSELRIEGLPPLQVITRIDILPPELQDQGGGGALLHRPNLPPIRATLHAKGQVPDGEEKEALVRRAEEYTRMMFWSTNGSRMDWGKVDFSYLFLPYDDAKASKEGGDEDEGAGGGEEGKIDEEKGKWEERRSWRAALPHPHAPTNGANTRPFHPSDNILCQARKFGEQYGYPADITLVKPGLHFGKGYRFVRWRYEDEPLTEREEMSIGDRYAWMFRRKNRKETNVEKEEGPTAKGTDDPVPPALSTKVEQPAEGEEPLTTKENDTPPTTESTKDRTHRGLPEGLTITWPILEVEPMPARTNFLIATPPIEKPKRQKPTDSDLDSPSTMVLLPEYSAITLLSKVDIEYATLLPSILRHFTISLTADSLRRNLFLPGAPRDAGGQGMIGPTQPELELEPRHVLSTIPLPLLTTALLTPSASEQFNYQRLECLGDTVIKFLVSFQLFAEYPLWHEGYLTQRKDRVVSNGRLAKDAVAKELYKWMIRDRLISKKWRPSYLTPSPPKPLPVLPIPVVSEPSVNPLPPPAPLPPTKPLNVPSSSGTDVVPQPQVSTEQGATGGQVIAVKTKKKRKGRKAKKPVDGQELSTKMLADVVEALMGASYLFGGFDLAFQCGSFFGLGMRWEPAPSRFESILAQLRTSRQPFSSTGASMVDSTVDNGDDDDVVVLPAQLKHVEKMLGYTFKNKALLIEALTHASYQQSVGEAAFPTSTSHPTSTSTPSYQYNTRSYERLEFLGDAILDMILVDTLFHAPNTGYSPGHIHQRKMALVNAQFLAWVCLKTGVGVSSYMPRPKVLNAGLGSSQHREQGRRNREGHGGKEGQLSSTTTLKEDWSTGRRTSFSSALAEPSLTDSPGVGGDGTTTTTTTTSIELEKMEQKVWLWQCLLHSSTRILEDQTQTYGRFKRHEKVIEDAFTETRSPTTGTTTTTTGDGDGDGDGGGDETPIRQQRIFPWASLTSLQAPKFFSDIIESLIGAVFLDSSSPSSSPTSPGSPSPTTSSSPSPTPSNPTPSPSLSSAISSVHQILSSSGLGILPIMDQIINEDIDVLHPVTRLLLWADKQNKKVEFKYVREGGYVEAMVVVSTRGSAGSSSGAGAGSGEDSRGVDEGNGGEGEGGNNVDDGKVIEVVSVKDVYFGKQSVDEVKYRVAEKAVGLFRLRDGSVKKGLEKKLDRRRRGDVEF